MVEGAFPVEGEGVCTGRQWKELVQVVKVGSATKEVEAGVMRCLSGRIKHVLEGNWRPAFQNVDTGGFYGGVLR